MYDPQFLEIPKQPFAEQSLEAAISAKWVNVLCIHTDADDVKDESAFEDRIYPAIKAISESAQDVCKNIVPLVPVHMTEAWMLADTGLLIEEIGSNKTEAELKLPTKVRQIEDINNPKMTIENAISLAFADQLIRRRRGVTISDLYSPLSQTIPLEKLEMLTSYKKFRQAAEAALRNLKYLQ